MRVRACRAQDTTKTTADHVGCFDLSTRELERLTRRRRLPNLCGKTAAQNLVLFRGCLVAFWLSPVAVLSLSVIKYVKLHTSLAVVVWRLAICFFNLRFPSLKKDMLQIVLVPFSFSFAFLIPCVPYITQDAKYNPYSMRHHKKVCFES